MQGYKLIKKPQDCNYLLYHSDKFQVEYVVLSR